MSEAKPPVSPAPAKTGASLSPVKTAETHSANTVADVAAVAAGNVNAQGRSNRLKKTSGTVREVIQGSVLQMNLLAMQQFYSF